MSSLSESYRVLDLVDGASVEEIKEAYRTLVRVWHPDRFYHDKNLQLRAEEKLKAINAAYEVLLSAAEDRRHSIPRQDDPGLRIGACLYTQQVCVCVDSLPFTEPLAREKLNSGSEVWFKKVANYRGVRFSVVQEAGGMVSHLSFESRAATHFGTKGATLGMVGFSLALIFLRDLLRQRPTDRQRKAATVALKRAGCDSTQMLSGSEYLKAEQELCLLTSEEFLRQCFANGGMVTNTKEWFSVFAACWWGDDLASSVKWLAYALKGNPAAVETWPQLLKA